MSEGAAMLPPVGPGDGLGGWWQRMVRWWHAAFAACLVVTATVTLASGAAPVILVPLGLLAVAYVTVGIAPLIRHAPVHAVVYVAVAAVLLAATVLVHPAGLLLLTCLYPQCFAMLDGIGLAAAGAAVVTVGGYAALAADNDFTRAAWTGATVTGLVNLTLAIALGAFIRTIIREAERRAELVRELTAAQDDLAAAHHAAGAQAERDRLAREIHDTLAQGFTSIVVLARALDVRLADATDPDDPAVRQARDTLAVLEETAQANLAEARALVAAQPPADLHEGGLLAALRRTVDRCGREAGVRAGLRVTGEVRALPQAHDVVLLRVAQEALANVARHAAATEVVVDVTFAAAVTLSVTDDGVGLGVDRADSAGFGLAGMRQRVEEAGGTLCVESAPGRGTTVRVALP